MKKWTVLTLFVLVAMVLAACGPTTAPTQAPAQQPAATTAPAATDGACGHDRTCGHDCACGHDCSRSDRSRGGYDCAGRALRHRRRRQR